MDKLLNNKLLAYANNPQDAFVNFELGVRYMQLGQRASAISYILRAAELTDDNDLAYTCLLLNYENLNVQVGRSHSAKGQLLHAITLQPNRPEAYYMLSLYFEIKQQWQEAYTVASIAETLKPGTTYAEVNYPGEYGPMLQKAITGWYLGYGQESRRLFRELIEDTTVRTDHRRVIENNIKNLG